MNIKTLLLVAALATSSVYATAEYEGYDTSDCCRSSCYECSCNPLYCGAWSIQVHGGVAPIIWHKRGELDLVSCTSNALNPLIQLTDSFPKFSSLYKLPWYVGFKLGYDVTDNIEFYLEFDYLQAKRKNNLNANFIILNPGLGQTLQLTLGKYKLFEGYVGVRYYWDRWCDRVAFFLGGKVGFTAHRSTRLALALNGVPILIIPTIQCANGTVGVAEVDFFGRRTNVSGGLNFGFDVCFCGNWSFVLTGEVVASCGPHSPTTLVFAAPTAAPLFATGLVIGGIHTELRFPVTAGIRYTF